MNAELQTVKLSKIDPNPFRDGSGGTPPATWESVAEAYGFDEGKLEELAQSYQANGVWAGVHVRPSVGSRYQLVFGHHRVEAARRLKLESIPVIVADLDNDSMVKMMAAENSEEYGHDFALGVMNAVEAVVKAYGVGQVGLRKPDTNGARLDRIREAPSFRSNGLAVAQLHHPYSATTVGEYLGWTVTNTTKNTYQAADRVQTAIAALELIEMEALKRSEFKGLGASQAKELVTLTRRKITAEQEKIEVQEAFLQRARAQALAEDDKRKAASVQKKLEELEAEGSKVIKAAGRQVAGAVTAFYKEGESFAAAARRAAEELDVAPPVVKAKAKGKLNLTDVDTFAKRLDVTLLADDARWKRVLEIAEGSKASKTFRVLGESLDNLAERAKLRAKELRKVTG